MWIYRVENTHIYRNLQLLATFFTFWAIKWEPITMVINPILVGGGGKNAPPVLNLEKNQTLFGPKARRGSEFIFILVLHVLAKKTHIIGLSKEIDDKINEKSLVVRCVRRSPGSTTTLLQLLTFSNRCQQSPAISGNLRQSPAIFGNLQQSLAGKCWQ